MTTGQLLFLGVESMPCAGLLVAAGLLAIWGCPRALRVVLICAGLETVIGGGMVALATAASTTGGGAYGPAVVPLLGLQVEEVLWPAAPIALGSSLVLGIGVLGGRALTSRPGTRTSLWIRQTLAAVALAAALAWSVLSWPLLPLSFAGWGNTGFDPPQWRASTGGLESVRGAMLRSLLRDWRPRGRTRAEVIATLGPPDGEGERILEYAVGTYSGFGIDEDFLDLYIGPDGRVIGWRVYQS